jgi:hypothetical protein
MSCDPNAFAETARRARRFAVRVGGAVLACSSAVGCASDPSGPAYLAVPQARYEEAFKVACEVARAEGLVPETTDQKAGAIETVPKFAGSVIEPWAWSDLTASEIVEGTFGFERRRARFEFVPAGFRPSAPEGTAPLAGPILPGSERGQGADVARAAGDLEVRVSVSVERRFRPGYQGGAYTRSLGSYSRDVTLKDDPSVPRDRSTLTPIARDERLERLLIARLTKRLAEAPATAPAAAQ